MKPELRRLHYTPCRLRAIDESGNDHAPCLPSRKRSMRASLKPELNASSLAELLMMSSARAVDVSQRVITVEEAMQVCNAT